MRVGGPGHLPCLPAALEECASSEFAVYFLVAWCPSDPTAPPEWQRGGTCPGFSRFYDHLWGWELHGQAPLSPAQDTSCQISGAQNAATGLCSDSAYWDSQCTVSALLGAPPPRRGPPQGGQTRRGLRRGTEGQRAASFQGQRLDVEMEPRQPILVPRSPLPVSCPNSAQGCGSNVLKCWGIG